MKLLPTFLAFALSFSITSRADDVVLKSARFDNKGKLKVVVDHPGVVGCYVTVLGGLTRSDINTSIIGITVSAKDVRKDKVTIKTVRKYFCKKRKLYVQVERVCTNDVSLIGTSAAIAVSVPKGNLKR